ncbi:MAG: DUF3341 domain-containing protein [Bryobacteraceae bacterium]|nr:DUF3341 domain-containing protein [Bryobacteraceae bacterium]
MSESRLYGAVAEFQTPEDLLEAARAMRQRGFTHMDACTPFPVHGINEALGIRRSPLGWLALVAGCAGCAGALLLQWWTGAVSYPLAIGGKPLFAFEPSIPITFEATVLLAAFATVAGMLALNGLPRLYHPLFQHQRFQRVTDDAFALVVEASDPKFHATETPALLRNLGAADAQLVEEGD